MSRFFESIIFLQILCSISTSEAYHRHKRIIDGEATQINYYPHQVSLRMVQNDRHYCGGALISENWILSAGQCTQGEKSSIENIYIVAGATNITSGGQRFDLDLIVTHPNFNWAKRENDISMLRTQQPMPLIDNRIFPIALPSYATDYKMENNIGLTYVTISGWGVFDENLSQEENGLSPVLRAQEINVLTRTSCRRHLGHVNGLLLHTKNICTQNRNGQGICVGDIGSPLVTRNKEIVGIASWRMKSCGMGYPDVYTRVFAHLEWIWGNLIR